MPDMMPRRAFVTLLGGAAIWSQAARAQKSDGVRHVGVIMGFAENDEVWQVYLATFRKALQDLGWTDGVTSDSITGSPVTASNLCAAWRRKLQGSRLM